VDFLRALFSARGLFIVIYILIGVFVNTAILFWPLSFWHPTFNVGTWPAGSAP
jgi:hypothetical protein